MDKNKIKQLIKPELDSLERLVGEMDRIIEEAGGTPDFIETRAAGSVMHDFYCGSEKIFKRIAVHVDGRLPEGDDWHKDLLMQMTKPIGNVRPRVIDDELCGRLKELLRFRHLFRNIYGFELTWHRFSPIALSLRFLYEELQVDIEAFLNNLE